jgi:hypothetical protein
LLGDNRDRGPDGCVLPSGAFFDGVPPGPADDHLAASSRNGYRTQGTSPQGAAPPMIVKE